MYIFIIIAYTLLINYILFIYYIYYLHLYITFLSTAAIRNLVCKWILLEFTTLTHTRGVSQNFIISHMWADNRNRTSTHMYTKL